MRKVALNPASRLHSKHNPIVHRQWIALFQLEQSEAIEMRCPVRTEAGN